MIIWSAKLLISKRCTNGSNQYNESNSNLINRKYIFSTTKKHANFARKVVNWYGSIFNLNLDIFIHINNFGESKHVSAVLFSHYQWLIKHENIGFVLLRVTSPLCVCLTKSCICFTKIHNNPLYSFLYVLVKAGQCRDLHQTTAP